MSGVDELVEWLSRQLDEDGRLLDRLRGAMFSIEGSGTLDELDAMAWLNEERLSCEIEAKRRRVDRIALLGRAMPMLTWCGRGVWDHLLRLEALPYSDRPGYREEWRP